MAGPRRWPSARPLRSPASPPSSPPPASAPGAPLGLASRSGKRPVRTGRAARARTGGPGAGRRAAGRSAGAGARAGTFGVIGFDLPVFWLRGGNRRYASAKYWASMVTMAEVGLAKGFTNSFREIFVTSPVRPRAEEEGRPMIAPASPTVRRRRSGRRTTRDQGEQGQERRRGRGGAEVVAVQDQPVRAGQDRPAAAGGRATARLLPDHRVPPGAPSRASRGRGAEGLVGGIRRQHFRGLPAVHRPGA